MPSLSSTALLALLVAVKSSAQSTTVWSSFAFVLHGDRTPLRSELDITLTPLGAQQLHAQGSLFRTRYLSDDTNLGENSSTSSAPIFGLERDVIDNKQLDIWTNTDDFQIAGSLAFMQGLYPPVTKGVSTSSGGYMFSLANGSVIDFPLGGYQYPSIKTLSVLDSNSAAIQGHVNCPMYSAAATNYAEESRSTKVYDDTDHFYQTLWDSTFSGSDYPPELLNFNYAYDLYDYANYQYIHNATVGGDGSTPGLVDKAEISVLQGFANMQQFALNGNLSVSGNTPGDMIMAIAGRTLAGQVIDQFKLHVTAKGNTNKLGLMFGDHQPMMAFFALSDLINSYASNTFMHLPPAGSLMVFELFSNGNGSAGFPRSEDLFVRFLFRGGADDEPLREYPLFGRGVSVSAIQWVEFINKMDRVAISSTSEWCSVCESVSQFCQTSKNYLGGSGNSGSSGSSSSSSGGSAAQLSAPLAGLIGAIAAIAVLALAATTAFVFGGVRIRRQGHEPKKGSLRGFKGAEKMASDHDVSIAKNGAQHARMGSWELGKSSVPAPPEAPPRIGPDVFGASFRRDDDDVDSILGRAPVKPTEGV